MLQLSSTLDHIPQARSFQTGAISMQLPARARRTKVAHLSFLKAVNLFITRPKSYFIREATHKCNIRLHAFLYFSIRFFPFLPLLSWCSEIWSFYYIVKSSSRCCVALCRVRLIHQNRTGVLLTLQTTEISEGRLFDASTSWPVEYGRFDVLGSYRSNKRSLRSPSIRGDPGWSCVIPLQLPSRLSSRIDSLLPEAFFFFCFIFAIRIIQRRHLIDIGIF